MRSIRSCAVPLLALLSCVATITIVPGGDIEVLGPDGKPVVGAKVIHHAELRPHARSDDPTFEHESDEQGHVTLKLQQETVGACWCIPHGVGAYTHTACAEHPSLGARVIDLRGESPWRVQFTAEDKGLVCTADSRGRFSARAPTKTDDPPSP